MEFQKLEALFSHHNTQLADAEKHTTYFLKARLILFHRVPSAAVATPLALWRHVSCRLFLVSCI